MLLILVFLFYIFIHNLFPAVYGGDSGELAVAGVILGVPHAPGYPLYCLLAKIAGTLLNAGNQAYRINAASAILGSINVYLIYRLSKSIFTDLNSDFADTKIAGFTAFVSALTIAVMPIFFEQSITAEVFGLNLFFFVLISIILREHCNSAEVILPPYILASFLFALALGNHHTILLALPGFLTLIFLRLGRRRFTKVLSSPAPYGYFLLGLSVYFYLLIRAQSGPALNFMDPDNLRRLSAVFLRREFGSLSLHPSVLNFRSFESAASQIIVYGSTMIKQTGILGAVFGILGIIAAVSTRHKELISLAVTFFVSGPLFVLYSNMPANTLANWRLERFYLLPGAIFVVFIFYGLLFLLRLLKLKNNFIKSALALGVFIVLFTQTERIKYSRNNFVVHDLAVNLARSVSKGGVLVFGQTLFDEHSSGFLYLREALGKRPDIDVLARSGSMFKNIYGDDFFDKSPVERERIRVDKEKAYLAKHEGSVFLASMDKNALAHIGKFYCSGLIYKNSRFGQTAPWLGYSRREVFPERINYADCPSRLVLAHYPYFNAKCSEEGAQKDLMGKYFNECEFYGGDFQWLKYNIGSVYLRIGMFEKARRYYEMSNELDPYFPDNYFGLGYVFIQEGNLPGAKKAFEMCLKLNPDFYQAYYNLGVVEDKMGNHIKADEYFQKYKDYGL